MNTSLPRGLRNNNPLNIKFSAVKYAEKITGEQKQDPVFEEFTSLRYGYLAALRLINRYMIQHHLYTLSAIIGRWCPSRSASCSHGPTPPESLKRQLPPLPPTQQSCAVDPKISAADGSLNPRNDTYLSYVCRNTGIGGNENLSPLDPRLKDVVFWMACMENGPKYVTEEHREIIERAWADYLQCVVG